MTTISNNDNINFVENLVKFKYNYRGSVNIFMLKRGRNLMVKYEIMLPIGFEGHLFAVLKAGKNRKSRLFIDPDCKKEFSSEGKCFKIIVKVPEDIRKIKIFKSIPFMSCIRDEIASLSYDEDLVIAFVRLNNKLCSCMLEGFSIEDTINSLLRKINCIKKRYKKRILLICRGDNFKGAVFFCR